jgi:2-keto-4-pentenoate hydratase/2-oxohepta-3-ene-1,7-dioic acid hydratase in catechol pathway
MELVTFRHDGVVRHGRLIEDGTVVLPLGNGDLTALLSGRNEATAAGPAFPLLDVDLLAPLLRPGKLLSVAPNHGDTSDGAPPRLFLKPPTCVAGPGADIAVPVGKQVTATTTLAVVIGTITRDVPVANALAAVGGYMTAGELTTRTTEHDDFVDSMTATWFDGSTPMGPWLVTPDEAFDPQALDLTFDIDGTRRQDGSTKDMVHPVAELVSYASTLMTLEPGDVLMTGSPTATPVAAGTEVSMTIAGLGTLVNRLVG